MKALRITLTLRRSARRLLLIAGLAAVSVLLVACGLLAYLHTAAGRRFLAAKVNAWVSREIVAELRIERIDVLSNDRLVISGATLLDTKGRAVLRLRGLSAPLDAWTLLRNALEPTARVELRDVRVESLEVGLYRSESGGVSLADAFESRTPVKSKTPRKPGAGPLIQLPHVAVGSATVRTDFAGLSRATAELRTLNLKFDFSPDLLSLGLGTADARVLDALPLDAKGRLNAVLRFPGVIDASFDGSVGAAPVQASFRAKGDDLGLHVNSESLAPDTMRALISSWPVRIPLSARIALTGPATALSARVETQAEASRLEATGTLSLTPTVKGEFSLTARELDARLLAPGLAKTAVMADGKLEFASEPAPHVALHARLAQTELSGVPLPETNIVAVYADNQVTGSAASLDPALPVSVDVHVSPAGALSFHARAPELDLAALAPYGFSARGRAAFEANGELRENQLSAQLDARVRTLQLAPLLAQSTLIRAKLRGPIAQPEQLTLEVEAQGGKLALGAVEFPVWAFESRGSLRRQLVSARAGPQSAPGLQVSTTLAFGAGVSLSETRIAGELRGVKHDLELESARFANQLVELNGLRWQVASGSLKGSARLSPTDRLVDLEVSGLQPELVSKMLGLGSEPVRGKFGATLHFEERGRVRRGKLEAVLTDGTVASLGAVHGELSASLSDSELDGDGELIAPGLGRGKLSMRGTLPRAPLGLESATRTVGQLQVDLSSVELEEAGRRWLPAASVLLKGHAAASVRLNKWEANAPASLSYEFKTTDLGIQSQRSNSEGTLRHGEIASHGEIGASNTALQVELNDGAGPWLSAKIEQRLALADWLHALRSSSLAELLDAPLRAAVGARPRSLELLGGNLSRGFSGEIAANCGVTGSLRHPEFEASLNATGLGGVSSNGNGKLTLHIDYSAAREEYAVSARYAASTRAKLDFSGGGHWSWLEHGFGENWSAQGVGKIENIDLAPIGQWLAVPLSGEAGGSVSLNASSEEFEAEGQLALQRLTLERQALGNGAAKLRVHRGLAEAELKLASADSTLELSGELGLCWKGGPCVDSERGGSVDGKVRNYQLATLAPVLRSVASDVRGPLNGFISLAWDPADATGKRATRVRADAVVSGGSVTLSAGAGSFRCAKLRALGEGTSTLKLAISGCARSSQTNVWVDADVALNGPAPQRVTATLYTRPRAGKSSDRNGEDPGGKVPVTFDGVTLGSANVRQERPIKVTVDLASLQRSVEASIPELEFELPVKDDTSLVELTEDPAIVIADQKAPPELSVEQGESTPWKVSVKLGNAVSIKQPGMRVPVTGALTQSADGLLDGNIILPEGGVVPQLGQIFRLKRSRVRFNHQPLKDGALNIEASTRTAEGVVVDLFVSGTIEKPVIRLRSDPPRSENDIVALLLGVQGSDTVNSNGQQGADLRGSATALAMNQLLRGSALAGFQFGAGQTHQGDSVSTVSMRASNTVWLEGRTVRTSTQRAANSGVQSSGVIDWRFARGFSLRTQLGTISGLELRWSHRY